jgi:hypothetical protein
MTINEQSISAYKQILTNPAEFNMPFKSIDDIFEPSSTAIAKHIVYEKYQRIIDRNIPKLIFYIIMDGIFAQRKADDGNLGYLLKFNS